MHTIQINGISYLQVVCSTCINLLRDLESTIFLEDYPPVLFVIIQQIFQCLKHRL